MSARVGSSCTQHRCRKCSTATRVATATFPRCAGRSRRMCCPRLAEQQAALISDVHEIMRERTPTGADLDAIA